MKAARDSLRCRSRTRKEQLFKDATSPIQLNNTRLSANTKRMFDAPPKSQFCIGHKNGFPATNSLFDEDNVFLGIHNDQAIRKGGDHKHRTASSTSFPCRERHFIFCCFNVSNVSGR